MTSPRFPRMFGKYALLRPFARGGMGEIYLAAHGDLGGAEKLCLIKKVPEDRDAPGLTARLLDEAKVAVRLNHTNLVQVFDAGEVDSELYIAMELIEGRDLRAVWNRTAERRSRIPLDVALYVVREIARGLEYAHGYGGLNLIHRDIAPPNILLSWHGEVKVTDFGLARSILKNEKTAPGIVYGRIAYLAPEQARGEQADARTDVFATGIILWELLTGRPLHESSEEAVKNIERARHPRIEAPSHLTRGLPASVDAVVLKALAVQREDRYRSAEDFRKAVADELARLSPGTDSSRVGSFLRDLFGDDIKREADERERLLREELPKLRQRERPPAPPPAPHRPPTPTPLGIGQERPRPTNPPKLGKPLKMDPPTRLDRLLPPPEVNDTEPRLSALRSGKEAPEARPRVPPHRPTSARAPAAPPVPSEAALTIQRPAPPLRRDDSDLLDEDGDEMTIAAPAPSRAPRSPRPTAPSPQEPRPRPLTPPPKDVRPRSAPPPSAPGGAVAAVDAAAELATADMIGQLIDGRYRIERLLGIGGMGAVYEAEHVDIGRKVALKVLHPQFSRQADLVARFRREARAASKVGHPNIVDVTDSGTTEQGDVYFIMERLDGIDLGEVLRQERTVTPERTVAIATQLCRALSAAHAAGIIHRDLKPENIFLVAREGVPDFVKVLDFGIAKSDMGNQNLPRRLTTPGVAMGTPEYMAPEQAAGKAIDGRVDIYSVGAILYEMLTGQPPHAGDNAFEVLAKKIAEPPAPPRTLNPHLPEPLERVVLACLERDPDQRPQTMGALEYELTKCMKGRGSAVAAVLGIKGSEGPSAVGWSDESSKPRLFDQVVMNGAGSSSPPPPVAAAASDAEPRVAEKRVRSRDAMTATLPMEESRRRALMAARRARPAPRSRLRTWAVAALGALALLAGSVWLVGRALHHRRKPAMARGTATANANPNPNANANTNANAKAPVPVVTEVKAPVVASQHPTSADQKPSDAAIASLLEWARRAAAGGRIVAPPGDNLRELLERIEHAEPGNPAAEALRRRTTEQLNHKGTLALHRSHYEEAEQIFKSLMLLRPDLDWPKQKLARVLVARAEHALRLGKHDSAIAHANAALQLEPESTSGRLVLADAFLKQGKRELAAEEYQRVLDLRPTDKRAKKGLAAATAPPPHAPQRHKRRRHRR